MQTSAFWKMKNKDPSKKKKNKIKGGNGRGNKQQINLSVVSIKNL